MKDGAFVFSLLRVMGLLLYLLHGSWEIHLLSFGTTFIFITISGIKGSHWARVHRLWDWNGSRQQRGFGGREAAGLHLEFLDTVISAQKCAVEHYGSGVK